MNGMELTCEFRIIFRNGPKTIPWEQRPKREVAPCLINHHAMKFDLKSQFHAPAALSFRKETLVFIVEETGSQVENYLCPCQEMNS
jgi:hypothetical protein